MEQTQLDVETVKAHLGDLSFEALLLKQQVRTLQGMLADPERIGDVPPIPFPRERDEAG